MNIEELNQKMKVAIFDMDGTIVDSLPFFKKFWRIVGKKYYNDPDFYPPLYIDKTIRTTPLVESAYFMRRELGLACSDDEFLDLVVKVMDDFYAKDAKLKVGVLEYLTYLRAKGIRACVASASSVEYIKYNLEKYGIADMFDFVISCVDIGSGKDKPDIYLAALERFGSSLDQTCVFEDSFVALETAKRAGFITVGIHDNGNYDHDKLMAASDYYLADGMTFNDLICK